MPPGANALAGLGANVSGERLDLAWFQIPLGLGMDDAQRGREGVLGLAFDQECEDPVAVRDERPVLVARRRGDPRVLAGGEQC